MGETNTDTYLYLCNGAENTSGLSKTTWVIGSGFSHIKNFSSWKGGDLQHRWWFRENILGNMDGIVSTRPGEWEPWWSFESKLGFNMRVKSRATLFFRNACALCFFRVIFEPEFFITAASGRSCLDLLTRFPYATNGYYWLNPDSLQYHNYPRFLCLAVDRSLTHSNIHISSKFTNSIHSLIIFFMF